MDDIAPVLEALRTNQRINLLLLDAIEPAGMQATLSTRGGRSVARQFAHMHNLRRDHLLRRAKMGEELVNFESKEEPSRAQLKKALNASAKVLERFFAEWNDGVAGRRGMKKGVPTYLAYWIAHESHHRGSILLTLKQTGHPVPKDVRYQIWDWDRA